MSYRKSSYSSLRQKARRIRTETGLPMRLAEAIDALGVPVLKRPERLSDKRQKRPIAQSFRRVDGDPDF